MQARLALGSERAIVQFPKLLIEIVFVRPRGGWLDHGVARHLDGPIEPPAGVMLNSPDQLSPSDPPTLAA